MNACSVHNVDHPLPLADASISLITVVQAAHWFNLDPFFADCKRVLQPGGTLALIAYALPVVSVESCPLADAVINRAIEQVSTLDIPQMNCS